jgi:hypothetical protein
VTKGFEVYRRLGHSFVDGWLAPEVLAIAAVLDSAQRSNGTSGAVAEIGVHHGRLFIGLSLLQHTDEHSVAVDVFGDQELNIDNSGKGDLAIFRRNVERWSSLNNVAIHQGDSTELSADTLRELSHSDVRLFSVDGGHTDSIVYSDMNLAEATIAAGGIVIADDIFNEEWPGVSTGTLRYLNEGGQLVPFAIGFNKVFFSLPAYADAYRSTLQKRFEDRYLVSVKSSNFATHDVLILGRVPRRPRQLAGRNKRAMRIYRSLQERRR